SAVGTQDMMFRRMAADRMDPEKHPELAARVVALRDEVHERLKEQGLDKVVHRFDPDRFNPALPLGGNLMFAAPIRSISQAGLALERSFLAMIIE
ncbi:MAG TPA: ABC transporter permease, partial [Sulfitobacter sp.]|nr:ABC transporter permease [Sulfitobacter sp.]